MCPACQPVLERNLELLLYRLKERFLESLVSSRFPIGTVESLVNWNHWTPLEILFARAEGLHAHGHSAEACELGIQLATELLANPPDLLVELPPVITKSGKKKKTNPACHQISCLASATLAKCAFLCTVLAENPDYYHLAFRVGMFGLELARPPATTKPLEVKLAHQESELVTLLKRIPLGNLNCSLKIDI